MTRKEELMPKWVPKAIILGFLIWIGIQLSTSVISKLSSFITSLVVSIFLSFILEPAVNWLSKRGWKRGVATFVVFFSGIVIITAFLFLVGSALFKQTKEFVENAPGLIRSVESEINNRFNTKLDLDKLIRSLQEKDSPFQNFTGRLASSAFTIGGTAIGFIFQLLTVFLFTFYLVADAPKLRKALLRRLTPARQKALIQTWEMAISKTGGYIYSRLLLAVFSIIFHGVAFKVIGINYALVMAIWVGVVSLFVPVIGTYLAGLLPALIALTENPNSALWIIAAVIIYQQVENYLVAPRITARTMSLHPAISFASVIIGASLFGTVGAFLALPGAAMIQAYISSKAKVHEIVEDLNIDLDNENESKAKVKRIGEELEKDDSSDANMIIEEQE